MADELNMPAIIPPVTFNPYKHHFGFLKAQMGKWQKTGWKEAEEKILLIGSNLIDLYTGRLDVAEICNQCVLFAQEQNLVSAEKLNNWLGSHEFKKIKLSDGSLWVIKQGLDPTCFLHIHPAKYSPFTVRVRASTLKTVLAFKVIKGGDENENFRLTTVNQIRRDYLGLSPVKALEKGKGINRIWSLFN
jgi:hypothetical protein